MQLSSNKMLPYSHLSMALVCTDILHFLQPCFCKQCWVTQKEQKKPNDFLFAWSHKHLNILVKECTPWCNSKNMFIKPCCSVPFYWGLDNFQNKHGPFPESTIVQSLCHFATCELEYQVLSHNLVHYFGTHNIKHPIPVRVRWESFEHERSGYQKLWQLEEWGSKACFSGETCASQVIVVSKNASQAWLLWLHLDLWPASISHPSAAICLNNSIHHKQPSQISTKNKNFWMFCLMFLQQKVQRFD